jgi:hypothetical protein
MVRLLRVSVKHQRPSSYHTRETTDLFPGGNNLLDVKTQQLVTQRIDFKSVGESG